MLLFWIAAAGLSLAAAAMIFAGASGAARRPAEGDPALHLYRRQMSEIDELVERGVLDEAERRAARAEAGRRLLSVSERVDETSAATAPGFKRTLFLGAAVATPLAAIALYFVVGAPGMADQPFALRLAQWGAGDITRLDPAKRAALLEQAVAKRPGDVTGLRFLARDQIASNQPFEAEMNLRRAIAIAPDQADLWVLLGEALMTARDGQLAPDAVEAFEAGLARDPKSVPARYFIGKARIEARQPAAGLAIWRELAAEFPAGSVERTSLETEIAEVQRIGVTPAPNALAGEGAQMQQAIEGMVAGLAARLKANPDDPEGWVRLVRAYTVMGKTAERDAALSEAQRRYAGRPEIVQALDQATRAP